VVLVARGYNATSLDRKVASVRRIDYKTPEALVAALATRPPTPASSGARVISIATDAQSEPVYGSPAQPSSCRTAETEASQSVRRVGDVIQIRLGGVTGDASYFVLSEEQRLYHRLPLAAFRPVISRARHLTAGAIATDDWRQLRDDGERVWLFDPRPSQTRIDAVKRYLDLTPERGGCDRNALKVRSRDPWYRTPIQRSIDGFMSGMSGWGPWVVFRRMPRLAATNTLYVVHFRAGRTTDERAAWAMWLLTSDAARHLDRIGRRYADGLVKFEPGDVAELPIATPARTVGAYLAYERAVRLLLKGKKSASRREADSWF
jgi:hypothetical protein